MKIKDYIKHLQKVCDKYPDIELVYSSDSEGNSFHKVHHTPTLGNFNHNEFIPLEQFSDYELDEKKDANAICVN